MGWRATVADESTGPMAVSFAASGDFEQRPEDLQHALDLVEKAPVRGWAAKQPSLGRDGELIAGAEFWTPVFWRGPDKTTDGIAIVH